MGQKWDRTNTVIFEMGNLGLAWDSYESIYFLYFFLFFHLTIYFILSLFLLIRLKVCCLHQPLFLLKSSLSFVITTSIIPQKCKWQVELEAPTENVKIIQKASGARSGSSIIQSHYQYKFKRIEQNVLLILKNRGCKWKELLVSTSAWLHFIKTQGRA